MNRLVIVGNGFDLAHGLKTSYEDFLVDLIISRIQEGIETKENELFDVNYQNVNYDKPIDWSSINSIEELKNNPRIYIESISLREKRYAQYVIKINSEFFKQILKECNWTDIEKLYFNFLINNCFYNKAISNKIDLNKVKKLNEQFETIKNELAKFIKKNNQCTELNKKPTIFKTLQLCFEEASDGSHISKIQTGNDVMVNCDLRTVFFVNFNYTSLLEKYLDNFGKYELMNIHGSIEGTNEQELSIIFGYGDDTHNNYAELENLDDNELLKHIKPFYYPDSSNYGDLIDFINGDVFDVYVIGHSLGLSDRVLLKTIFEHKKCKAIKLFHRGSKESQFKKRISLSRHFSDKISMRSKILDFDEKDVFIGNK